MLIADKIVGVIAPHDCLVCGREGKLLCGWCSEDTLGTLPSRCYRCHVQTQDFATCPNCRKVSSLANVWIRTDYDDLAKQLVHTLKFERAVGSAPIIAELMSEKLPDLPSDIFVSFVPTATSRRRQRGYDQAELIAKCLARQKGLKFTPLLARHGQSRQVGASRKIRLSQLKEAFRPISDVHGRKVLLIDDIVTTGATLEAAAEILKQNGAKRIYAATFAQKL